MVASSITVFIIDPPKRLATDTPKASRTQAKTDEDPVKLLKAAVLQELGDPELVHNCLTAKISQSKIENPKCLALDPNKPSFYQGRRLYPGQNRQDFVTRVDGVTAEGQCPKG